MILAASGNLWRVSPKLRILRIVFRTCQTTLMGDFYENNEANIFQPLNMFAKNKSSEMLAEVINLEG